MCLRHHDVMKEAYLLIWSSSFLDEDQGRPISEVVVRLDRVQGPYTAILKARGSTSEIELLAARAGIAARDVCWLTTPVSRQATRQVSES